MAGKGTFRIISLKCADILVLYAFFVMQIYLTDVWGLSFTHSAAILNIWGGIYLILPGFCLYLADTCLGHLRMMLLATISYTVGTAFIAMSTPPVLASATGMCKEYEPNCIGHTQRLLFYAGMVLVAIGRSGNVVSLGPLIDQQIELEEQSGSQLIGFIFVAVTPVMGVIALPYIHPWSIRFGIPAIFTAISTFLFVTHCRQYVTTAPQGSPITNVFRVFVASVTKIHQPFPLNAKHYNKDGEDHTCTRTRFLRGLEKAAIYNPNDDLNNKWRFCTVAEVEEAKIVVRMIPMWMTFIMFGIVSSLGKTYFVEQSSHMNRKVGNWNAHLQMLLLFSNFAFKLFNYDATVLSWKERHEPRVGTEPAFGIGVAMILSVLCCITAARIEKLRLNVIIQHDLLDRPDDDIPMSVYWLLFQFLLLAGVDAYLHKSVQAFYAYQAPDSMKSYLEHITNGMSGLGFMFSVLTVRVVGQVSERGGKKNWFQPTLNRSRLDKYYWVLAALCAVNFVIFVLVASMYRYNDCEAIDDDGTDHKVNMTEMTEETGTTPVNL